jgi:hypothetical protein
MSGSDQVSEQYPQEADRPQLTEQFLAASVRGLVEAQKALDVYGRESLMAGEQEGIPPAAWMWSDCRLSLPVRFGFLSKAAPTDITLV